MSDKKDLDPFTAVAIPEEGTMQNKEYKTWKALPEKKGSLRAWLKWFEVGDTKGLSMSQQFLFNPDLKPVEERRRNWRWYNFVNFWFADAINVNTMEIAGSYLGEDNGGLSWWLCWIAIWLGYTFAALFILAAQRVGSHYHVSFPVGTRASWGVYGSLWPVINRVVLAIIWWGSQSYILGQCIQLILVSIFGKHTYYIGVNKSTGAKDLSGGDLSTFDFLSFFLAWLFQLPFLWFPIQSLRHLFTVKIVVAPIAAFGLMIWMLIKADGAGSIIHAPISKDVPTSTIGWTFIKAMMSAISNYAALIMNATDFSRFAASPKESTWSQFLPIPIGFGITSLIGILISSAFQSRYTSKEDASNAWNPLLVMMKFVRDEPTAGNRAGVFFFALGFAIAQIGTNIVANSASAGTDLTAFLPRFINIRRGQYICAMIGLCICPWNFFSSNNNFTTYLSAYSVFLSSISGVILCDYFWLRRGRLELMDLYNGTVNSRYMYGKFGINWRGVLAYFLALVPNMPGFADAVRTTQMKHTGVPKGAVYLYNVNYFVGFIVAWVLYMAFCIISPPSNIPDPLKGRLFSNWRWIEEPDAYVEDFEDRYRNLDILEGDNFENNNNNSNSDNDANNKR